MPVQFSLLLHGLDMRDENHRARIPESLGDIAFESVEDLTYVVVICEGREAAHLAAQIARRVESALPNVTVVGVHDELVALTDVAVRTDVAHEAVRLWAAGKRRASGRQFPRPRQVVGVQRGRNSTKLYAWREVVSWVREVLSLDPEDGLGFLSDRQIAEVNARVSQVMPAAGEVVIRRVTSAAVRTERVANQYGLRSDALLSSSRARSGECVGRPKAMVA
ncbi:MAG: hypothetical protein ACRCYU_03595 [Nocardioides sp.]